MKNILLAIALIFCVSSFSQEYIYKHFNVDDGLPSSEVYDVYQDKLGYMWFATDKGLSRYNGYEFENFTTNDGLPGNTVLGFYPQEDGRIFCLEYHSKTLFYFNEVFEGFTLYPHNDKIRELNHSNTVVKSINVDKNGTLTLGGYGIKGFIKITANGKVIKEYSKDLIPEVSYPKRKPHLKLGVLTDSKAFGVLYFNFNSDENLTIIPIQNNLTSRINVTYLNDNQYAFIDRKLGIASKTGSVIYYESEQNPIGIKRINDHTFWVGYYSNGAEIRATSGKVIASFLPKKSVSSFLIDAEGSYWFTTLDDGVFYIKNPEIKLYKNEHVNFLVKDNLSNLYTSHHNGDIYRISKLKEELLYKGSNDRPAHIEFNSATTQIYGVSDYKMYNFTKKEPPVFIGDVRKLSEEILDPLINVVSNAFNVKANDSIAYFNVGIRTEDVCLFKDTIFIATPSGLYFQKDTQAKPYLKSPLLQSRLYDIDINKQKNEVYMASQGYGVIVYGDSIYNISKNDGLTNDIISEVHVENDSTLWACTNTGLNQIIFNPNKTYTIKTFTISDGLLSNDINDIEVVGDTVWVATKNGLCYFNKNNINNTNSSQIISLSLKEIKVNNNLLNLNRKRFNYDENEISFTVQAISQRNAEKITYLYRLKGDEDTWRKTKKREINLLSLAPDNYTFEVKTEIDGLENKLLIQYPFKISPPFWKSWWFITICVVLLIALIYLFFKIRVLSYNKDIIREVLRLALKRLKREEKFYFFRSNGEDFKIATDKILFVHAQGNYLDIHTTKKKYTIRYKIGNFISSTPDSLEYLRIHRSYIIRIDQVTSKGKNWVVVNDIKLPVGESYLPALDKLQF
ncbi:MAG: LytTR family transcriptional regulator DNA-binding domain-containing protein [Flavobacteriaceae bacterium]|nr:LytTR family transcriptional regulator DNA-binding domain-containing protein [Flavobacteriaceae bacterium]